MSASPRFFNEARAVSRSGHPGLVQISELGKLPDGGAYFVIEYRHGKTLGDRLKRLGVSPARARWDAHGTPAGLQSGYCAPEWNRSSITVQFAIFRR